MRHCSPRSTPIPWSERRAAPLSYGKRRPSTSESRRREEIVRTYQAAYSFADGRPAELDGWDGEGELPDD